MEHALPDRDDSVSIKQEYDTFIHISEPIEKEQLPLYAYFLFQRRLTEKDASFRCALWRSLPHSDREKYTQDARRARDAVDSNLVLTSNGQRHTRACHNFGLMDVDQFVQIVIRPRTSRTGSSFVDELSLHPAQAGHVGVATAGGTPFLLH